MPVAAAGVPWHPPSHAAVAAPIRSSTESGDGKVTSFLQDITQSQLNRKPAGERESGKSHLQGFTLMGRAERRAPVIGREGNWVLADASQPCSPEGYFCVSLVSFPVTKTQTS